MLVTRDVVGTASLCPIRVPENKLCTKAEDPGDTFAGTAGQGPEEVLLRPLVTQKALLMNQGSFLFLLQSFLPRCPEVSAGMP